MQDSLETLGALGLTLPSPAYLAGVIVFSLVGIIAFYYARRHGRTRMRWLALALMLYPYVVWQTWLLYIVGAGLTIAVWVCAQDSQ
jgi:ABC-type multidrug transport system permease subunit